MTNRQSIGITDKAIQEQFLALEQLMKSGNIKENFASAIPFAYSLFGSYVVNPCVISQETLYRMTHSDPYLYAAQHYNFNAIIAAIGEYQHPIPKMQKLVRHHISLLDRPIEEIFWDILSDAGIFGHSVNQMKDYKNKYIYDFTAIPPSTLLYQVDVQGKLLRDGGINQYYMNYLYGNTAGLLAYQGFDQAGGFNVNEPDPFSSAGDAVIPLRSLLTNNFYVVPFESEQMLHMTMTGIRSDTNPYGISVNRVSYGAWLSKQSILQFMLLKAYRSANPQLIAYINSQQNVSLNGENIDAMSAMQYQLSNNDGNSAILVPGMKDQIYSLDTIDMTTDLEMFVKVIDALNREILMGQLTPQTVMGGEGGSYALGASQQSTSNIMQTNTRKKLVNKVLYTYVKWILERYSTKDEYKTLGTFRIEERSLDEQRKALENYEILNNMGKVDNNDKADQNVIRDVMNMPEINKIIEQNDETNPNSPASKSNKDGKGRPHKSGLTHSQRSTARGSNKAYKEQRGKI